MQIEINGGPLPVDFLRGYLLLPGDAQMDNCPHTTDTNTQSLHQDHGHISHAELQSDIASSKLAWEAWKSNDPKQWDHAMDEKGRILKEDPKAWKTAMKEIDADEKQQALAKAELQKEMQAETDAAAAAKAQVLPAPSTDTAAAAQPPADAQPVADAQPMTQSDAAPMVVAHPGYSPDSQFAPAPPNTPAYDAAYNQPPAKFYGLNLGIVKFGVTNHGSIDLGVNIGLARGEVQAGLENRVDGEFMPVGGPLHARVGAGVGVNANGFHGEAGAGLNVFNLVGGDADVGARLGKDIGVDGDLRGRALLVNGQGDAGVSLGQNGLAVHGGGNADILQTVGARGGGRFDLSPQDTGVAAGVGLNVAGHTLDFGPSIDAYPTGVVAPDLHLDPSTSDKAPFFPTGDRALDQR
jgi:hypothetical protein